MTAIYDSCFYRNACLPVDIPRINRRGKSDASQEIVFPDKYVNMRTRGGESHVEITRAI